MCALRARGFGIYVPFGENTRSDLIAESRAGLMRVQCKSGRLRRGAVVFNTCSCYGHHRNPGRSRRDYVGDIDAFAVYCHDTSSVYLVPITDVPVRNSANLRVERPRNGQRKGIRFARDYEIGRVEIAATGELRASSGAG